MGKKAHDLKSNNPYDQSHSAFFGRSFRSGHHEGFAAVLEYKHTHPIVVDWIQEFNISETKNPLESISQQLEKHFPDQKNRQEQERQIASQYKQGIIPINVLLKYYNDDWWRLFQFAAENRLIVSHGNIKRLKLEQELIGDHLVVDAQTLIILAHYDCLASLQSIMESFAIVYLQAIHRLNDVHEDAAISLAKIILDDTFRVWRRGTYYRETAKNYDDSQALEKATRILHYVRTVLAGIKEIFPNDAEKWQQYTELKSIVLREVKEKT